MIIRDRVHDLFAQAVARAFPGAAGADFSVETPRDRAHGDFAVNAAMVLAKRVGKPPREVAQKLAEGVRALDADHATLKSVDVAGPGFINVRLAPDLWLEALSEVTREGERFGRSSVGRGVRVVVEYVSANPTGPMHVGHGRNAVVGDGVASVLAWSGHEVVREYYVNDAGAQVGVLARSVHLRYQELFGRTVTMPPKSYPGDYVKDIAAALKKEHGDRFLDAPEADWLALFRERAVAHVLELIRGDLAALGIRFDVWSSEKALYDSGKVEQFLSLLKEKGLVYEGTLPPPKSKKGQPPPQPQGDAEEGIAADEKLTLFKSSQFGDEVDRPVKKADGTPTYLCADIAYHWDKKQRGEKLVNVLGADHAGYVPRLEAALEALGGAKDDLHVVLIQMVNLTRGGEAVKMSKRAGTVVSLREVVEEVGRDATRFIFLTRRHDAQLDFDLELAKKQSMDNPVFYVQYGYARCASILRKAAEAGAAPNGALSSLRLLTLPEEQDLVRRVLAFPDLLAGAALAYEPHRVAFYLQETIAAFHSWYTLGKGDPEKRVIGPDAARTAARLYLVQALKQVLHNGLTVLGVSAPERMEGDGKFAVSGDLP